MSAEQTPDIAAARRDVRAAVWNMCDQIIADHAMWIGDDGKPLDYLPEREARIADFVREVADASRQALAPVLAAAVREAEQRATNEREAKQIAAGAADRFRDVLSECLGHPDENPGDDVLVAEVRGHFGKSGPEPTRWRDFCSGVLATIDQINAARAERADRVAVDAPEGGEGR